jgi:hypothetical protein
VYSNREKFCFLSHILPNQIRTKNIQVQIILIEKNKQKIIKARLYSTSHTDTIINSLNPFFITDFTEAEDSFACLIRKSTGHRLRWRAVVVFQIALHKKRFRTFKTNSSFLWRNWNYSK